MNLLCPACGASLEVDELFETADGDSASVCPECGVSSSDEDFVEG